MISGIDHIEIVVTDVPAYVAFLTSLGFEVVAETPHHGGAVELRPPGGHGPILELHRVMGEENPGVNHIAFACEDVQGAYEAFREAGLHFDAPPFYVPSTGRTNANLRDPDGRRVQLVDARRGDALKARRKR